MKRKFGIEKYLKINPPKNDTVHLSVLQCYLMPWRKLGSNLQFAPNILEKFNYRHLFVW